MSKSNQELTPAQLLVMQTAHLWGTAVPAHILEQVKDKEEVKS